MEFDITLAAKDSGMTVTVRQAACCRGVSLKAIYDLLWADRLPGAKKVGKQWQIPLAALQQERGAAGRGAYGRDRGLGK